jgi:hypothetical protein
MKADNISNNRRLAREAIAFRKEFGTYPFHHGYIVEDGEWKQTGGRRRSILGKIGKAFKSVGHAVTSVADKAVGAVENVAQKATSQIAGATVDDFNKAKGQLSKFGDDFVKGLEMDLGALDTGAKVLGNWVIKHPEFFAHVIVNVGIAIAFPELAPDLALETGGLLLTTVLQDSMGQPQQPTQADIDKMIAEAREKMQEDPTYQASMQTLGQFVGYVSDLLDEIKGTVDIGQDGENLVIIGTTPYGVNMDKIGIDINTDTYKLTLTNTYNNKVFDGGNYTDMITFDGGRDITYAQSRDE